MKLVRIVSLCLALSITALSAFAAPPQPCSCSYCPTVSPTTRCSTGSGTQTCGSWLAVTLCQPLG